MILENSVNRYRVFIIMEDKCSIGIQCVRSISNYYGRGGEVKCIFFLLVIRDEVIMSFFSFLIYFVRLGKTRMIGLLNALSISRISI